MLKQIFIYNYQFQFKSYCSSHRPAQKPPKQHNSKNPNDKCTICQESLVPRPCPKSILARCCSSWFHRTCIQKMALNSGAHHFKCPLCNDTKNFPKEMLEFGIYLPQKDASWETDGQFFANDSEDKSCGAKLCFCDKEQGRKYNFPDGIWELMNCHACGSCAIHVKCGGMEEFIDPQWHCYLCRRIVRSEEETRKRQMKPINEIWGTAMGKKPKKPKIESTLDTAAKRCVYLGYFFDNENFNFFTRRGIFPKIEFLSLLIFLWITWSVT